MAETRTYRVLIMDDAERSTWRDVGTVESYSKAAAERATIEAHALEEDRPIVAVPDGFWQPVAKTRKPDPQYEIAPWKRVVPVPEDKTDE